MTTPLQGGFGAFQNKHSLPKSQATFLGQMAGRGQISEQPQDGNCLPFLTQDFLREVFTPRHT